MIKKNLIKIEIKKFNELNICVSNLFVFKLI